jgi:hypothetical protein
MIVKRRNEVRDHNPGFRTVLPARFDDEKDVVVKGEQRDSCESLELAPLSEGSSANGILSDWTQCIDVTWHGKILLKRLPMPQESTLSQVAGRRYR